MSTQSPQQRLAALQKQADALKAQERTLKTQIAQDERKRDTRRKILIGALVITHASHDDKFTRWLSSFLNKTVTKTQDRELLAEFLSVPAAPTAPVTASATAPAETASRPFLSVVSDNQHGQTPRPDTQPADSFAAIFNRAEA